MSLHYKTYISDIAGYKGGKSKSEIESTGKKVYKLSSNENPLGSSPLAIEAITKHLGGLSEYPSPSDDALRLALSEHYDGVLSPEQFITTNSGVANIELIIRGFMDDDSECIYSSPFFTPYSSFPQKVGARSIDIPLLGDEFHLDLKGIEKAITPRTSLIFITSPNNPTGSYIKQGQIDDLLSILPDHVLLVFDEVYYQYPDSPDYVRALPYVLSGKNVIAINSLSKAYGLAGLRIGYSYSTAEVASYLQKFRRPFMLNTLSMEAAIAGLGDDEFIQKTTKHIHTEKQYLYQQLDKLDIQYWKTQGNFIMLKPKISPQAFEEKMIEQGVMIRTLDGFGSSDCVRVTIVTREGNDAFIEALKTLA